MFRDNKRKINLAEDNLLQKTIKTYEVVVLYHTSNHHAFTKYIEFTFKTYTDVVIEREARCYKFVCVDGKVKYFPIDSTYIQEI